MLDNITLLARAKKINFAFIIAPKGVYRNWISKEIPEHFSEVERAERVTVRYLTYENEQCDEELNGFSSICVQHEIDHLDGILFVDHISSLKRAMILRKLKKQQKANSKS